MIKSLTYYGSGQRIDAWLTSKFSYSRNFFHRIIERGGIRVVPEKGRGALSVVLKVKKSYKLKYGDVVHIESLERFMDGGILEESPLLEIRNKPRQDKKNQESISSVDYLTIYLEKKDYMVIYKPKGVLSHPNSVWDISYPSVVGGLYHYFEKNEQLPTMGSFIRAGLIHRLDKETDGLMLIAKTEKGLAYFKNLFQQKSLCETIEEKEGVPLKKYYKAVCDITESGAVFLASLGGKFPYIIDELVKPKVPHVKGWKRGITKILDSETKKIPLSPSLGRGKKVALYLEILTGRTHQIRYHLSEKGVPIVGDYLYNQGYEETKKTPMQLTAWKLEFLDCDGEDILISI